MNTAKIVEVCSGRKVCQVPIECVHKGDCVFVCADCGQPAKHLIQEIEGPTKFWFYCGMCEIGG